MVFQKQFQEYDLVVEVYNHRKIEYCEHPPQSYLLVLWEKGHYRGNATGFEHKHQAMEAADHIRRGMSLAFHLKNEKRDIHIIETNEDHEITTHDYIPSELKED